MDSSPPTSMNSNSFTDLSIEFENQQLDDIRRLLECDYTRDIAAGGKTIDALFMPRWLGLPNRQVKLVVEVKYFHDEKRLTLYPLRTIDFFHIYLPRVNFRSSLTEESDTGRNDARNDVGHAQLTDIDIANSERASKETKDKMRRACIQLEGINELWREHLNNGYNQQNAGCALFVPIIVSNLDLSVEGREVPYAIFIHTISEQTGYFAPRSLGDLKMDVHNIHKKMWIFIVDSKRKEQFFGYLKEKLISKEDELFQ